MEEEEEDEEEEEGEGYPGMDRRRTWSTLPKSWVRDDGVCWLQIGKNGRTFFGRPKPTVGCSASGRRRRGRPRKRWKEEAERDLQVLGVRRWRELVADREKWKDIFRQAKVDSGL
jgi:hypothetical protein